MTVSGCVSGVFGIEPAAEFEDVVVKEAEDGLDVVVVTEKVFEVAFEVEGDAEFGADAESVNIAETKAVDKAGAGLGVVAEHKSAAAFGLVASGSEQHYNLSSVVVVAWDSVASFGVVFEPRVEFVFVVAFEDENMMAPCGNIEGGLSEVLAEAQSGSTEVEAELVDRSEIVAFDLFADNMPEEQDVSAGERLDFVALVWVATAGVETVPGSNPGDKAEVVLQPVDSGRTLAMRL